MNESREIRVRLLQLLALAATRPLGPFDKSGQMDMSAASQYNYG